MGRRHTRNGHSRGAALLTALGLLVVFWLLGMAWVRYMWIQSDKTDYEAAVVRGHHVAAGGVEAALGEITIALQAGKVDQALAKPWTKTIDLPLYRSGRQGVLEKDESRHGKANITITDECARVNLNHALPSVLSSILSVDNATANKIRQALAGQGTDSARHWLTTPDDLVTRDLLTAENYKKLDKDLLTVYTVRDAANPSAYINVNTAPAPVLEAALNVNTTVAQSVVAARPLTSLAALSAKVGKDFGNPAAPDAKPLAFTSRCYRIVSEGTIEGAKHATPCRIEAVALFPEGGAPEIRYWNESR